MITVIIEFYPDGFGLMKPHSLQKKSFANSQKLIEWCMKNYEKIGMVNYHRTLGQPISRFELLCAISPQ